MQSRFWVLTDNKNHGKQAWMNWWEENSDELTYLLIKLEIGDVERRRHGQGVVVFKNRKRVNQVRDLLLPDVWNHRMDGSLAQAVTYVKKPETSVPVADGGWMLEMGQQPPEERGRRTDLETIRDLVLEGKTNLEVIMEVPGAMRYIREMDSVRNMVEEKKKHDLEPIQLRPWQESFLQILRGPVKQRRIFWVHSQFSRVGKTTTMLYISANKLIPMLVGDLNLTNLLCAYDKHKIIWFDFSRNVELTPPALNALEVLSNGGPIFSGKYVSSQKWVSSHIVVTSNMEPPFNALPKRIEAWELDADGHLIHKDRYHPNECAPSMWIEPNDDVDRP